MGFECCFPRLPSGGCWPPDPAAGYRRCFPSHELRPVQQGRAPSNDGLLPSVANVSMETAVVRLAAHVLRTNASAAGQRVARGRSRIRYAAG